MTVTARMTCQKITAQACHYQGNPCVGGNVELSPVWEGEDGQHAEYANATPSGRLELWIDNPAAFNQFEPGKVYEVVISEIG